MNETLKRLERVLEIRETVQGVTEMQFQYKLPYIPATQVFKLTHDDLREMIAATRRDHDREMELQRVTSELHKLECEYDELKAQMIRRETASGTFKMGGRTFSLTIKES